MKKVIAIVLLLVLALSLAACGSPNKQPAEAAAPSPESTPLPKPHGSVELADVPLGYNLGDRMPDFTVELDDGSSVSLYEMLKEKDAVLINLFASWCPPCRAEFPDIQEAYTQLKSNIGIIALSVDSRDTFEILSNLMNEIGVTEFSVGLDTNELFSSFGFNAMPSSVVVDRFGVICFKKTGIIPSLENALNLFNTFIGDDYTESLLLHDLPAGKASAEQPDEASIKKALGIESSAVSILPCDARVAWPFVLREEDGMKPSNS